MSTLRGRCAPTMALFRRSPAFGRLYMASLVSQLGDGGMLIAFPLLIAQQTHDVTLAGLAFPGEVLAFMLASPVAGWVADHWEQRRTMLLSDLVRALLLVAMVVLLQWTQHLLPLLLLSALIGASGAFFQPARAAYLRRLVTEDDYAEAVALEGTTHFLTRLISPAAMGLLLAVVPATVGIGVDAASFGLSALVLLPLFRRQDSPATESTVPETAAAVTESPAPTDSDWREGWRAVWQAPSLRWILAIDTALCVTGMASFGMLMAYLETVAHVGAHYAGWLLAIAGGCGAIGTRFAGRIGQTRQAYLTLVSLWVVAYALVGWGGSLAAIMVAWVIRGFGMGAMSVMIGRRIAEEVPVAVMGRATAAYDQICCAAVVVGGLSAPLLLRHVGAVNAYRGLSAMLLGVVVLGLASERFGRWSDSSAPTAPAADLAGT